ncbi:hypothetical protein GCM10010191_61380 [Actinomadura vinacea]|uniref:Uncharacterized protein n=1 Tax=Actinomadura vinacea TaxID=115336 RepID=A0ABN3JRD3_9ACTN
MFGYKTDHGFEDSECRSGRHGPAVLARPVRQVSAASKAPGGQVARLGVAPAVSPGGPRLRIPRVSAVGNPIVSDGWVAPSLPGSGRARLLRRPGPYFVWHRATG